MEIMSIAIGSGFAVVGAHGLTMSKSFWAKLGFAFLLGIGAGNIATGFGVMKLTNALIGLGVTGMALIMKGIFDHLGPKEDIEASNFSTGQQVGLAFPHVIFLLPAIASIGVLNLSLNGNGYTNQRITQDDLRTIQAGMTAAHITTPEGIVNQMILQKGSGLNGDDEAILIAPDEQGGYVVHKASLKPNTLTMTRPLDPADSNKPFFVAIPGGYAINPDLHLSFITGLLSASTSGQLKPSSAASALNLAAAEGHDVQLIH
jgi:hypothetical protein